MEQIDPKYLPKMVRKLAKWQRQYAPEMWATGAVGGTKFFAPPGMPPMVHQMKGVSLDPLTGEGIRVPTEETVSSYRGLAAYYAQTLEGAKCYHLSERMSNLALRTVMPRYKLTLDALRIGPEGGIVPWGFIAWSLPIGRAETDGLSDQLIDFRTGEVSYPELSAFSPYADADFPVVAASWRYEPEADIIWVAFYSQNSDETRVLRNAGYLTEDELAGLARLREPFSLEREQALPLGKSLNWCDADPADGPRLDLTTWINPDGYDREHLRQKAIRNNDNARTSVSGMVRALIASWLIMKWKVAHREEIPPPQDVIRELAKKIGHSKKTVAKEYGTTVVRLGAPIQKQAARTGAKEYTWKVRALVGPVVRDRQYIPAWGTYDEEPRFIEPYWAGPPDAPISNVDRVFKLGDD